jgi:ubiquinone/menaquinone biosynthesis C-methylase UbiE
VPAVDKTESVELPIPVKAWPEIIAAAERHPLSFFALGIIGFLTLVVPLGLAKIDGGVLVVAMGAYSLLFATVAAIVYFRPRNLRFEEPAPIADPVRFKKSETQSGDEDSSESGKLRELYGTDKPPPNLDTWYRRIRPSLHQASYYTVPTYYLDRDLYIVDYNIAFEVAFRTKAGKLRGKHVGFFIDILANANQVYEHGKQFTNRVKAEGTFPFVDFEPIVYHSDDFGTIEFTKVASQLHDAGGKLQGWAVALMPRALNWPAFEEQLRQKLFQDKLWSVYSGPYDRILPDFPAYKQLIQDVIAVVPAGGANHVADLGAGTGNVTAALLAQGHRVTAIENNVGMLDRFSVKGLRATIVKGSVDNLECLKDELFDAVVMVNVLYAVDDPLKCLKETHRILKPGGVIGFSTTHQETNLDELLAGIRAHLEATGKFAKLQVDFDVLQRINRDIEKSIARRFSRKQYLSYAQQAGFELTRIVDSTYHNAVMLVHAGKSGK